MSRPTSGRASRFAPNRHPHPVPWIDWLVLGAVAVGAYRGYKTGVLRQAVSILGWFVAFVLALQLMDAAGRLLVKSLPVDETLAPLVGFLVVLAVVRVGSVFSSCSPWCAWDAFSCVRRPSRSSRRFASRF
ncbi:MAG: hypothetical protein BRD44_05750 [Bacteroidetes bacterium QS_7_67_15]|nr:MAG: hypothetical protein BRD44_05750 [Bacteroidetes bacterium QS_7_67_15]